MKAKILALALAAALAVLMLPAAAQAADPAAVAISGHTAGNLGAEIDACMAANGIAGYGDIASLTVAGGSIRCGDATDTDMYALRVRGMGATLKTADFTATAFEGNKLPPYAFGNFTALTAVKLPDSVTLIDYWAFSACASLQAVYLPAGLTDIEYDVFHDSSALRDLYTTSAAPPSVVSPYAFAGVAEGAAVHVPAGSESAWDGKDFSPADGRLYQLLVENMAPVITHGQTRTSDSTATVNIGSSEPGCCYYAAVKDGGAIPVIDTSGAGAAFSASGNLTISLTALEPGAYHVYLKAKDLRGNVGGLVTIDIEAYAAPVNVVINSHQTGKLADEIDGFLNLSGIPGRYDKIISLKVSGGTMDATDWAAFTDEYPMAYAVGSVDLSGTSALNIPDNAFENYSMMKISLPSGIKSIGEYAFASCGNLAELVIPSSAPPVVGELAFDGVPATAIARVPAGSAAAYRSAIDGDPDDGLWYRFTIVEEAPPTCAVTFLSQGGGSVPGISAPYNSTIAPPPAPDREGYTFGGWYRDAACSVPWDFKTDRVTSNIVLYAKWEIKTYTVAFNIPVGLRVPSVSAKYNETIPKPDLKPYLTYNNITGSYDYYWAFVMAWYTDAAHTRRWDFAADTVTSDMTLYLDCSNCLCSVALKSWGDCVYINALYNTALTSMPVPEHPGYAIAGWYRDAAYTRAWNSTADKVTSAITLYAKWAKGYTVTFDSRGGTAVPNQATLPNTTIAAPGNPSKSRCRFGGWHTDAACKRAWVFARDKVTRDIRLYAKWTPATPGVPGDIYARDNGYDSVFVAWSRVESATGYEVYRSTSEKGKYGLAGTIKNGNTGSFIDKGLITGRRYYYKVRACNTAEGKTVFGGFTKSYSAIPDFATRPVLSAKTQSTDSVDLRWTKVDGATKYVVYYSDKRDGQYSEFLTTAKTSCRPGGLAAGKWYYFWICPYRQVGNVKGYGIGSDIVPAAPMLKEVTGVKAASASPTSVKLTWKAVARAAGYEIWRANSLSDGPRLLSRVNKTEYVDTGLTTGKQYIYLIRPYSTLGSHTVYGAFPDLIYCTPQ